MVGGKAQSSLLPHCLLPPCGTRWDGATLEQKDKGSGNATSQLQSTHSQLGNSQWCVTCAHEHFSVPDTWLSWNKISVFHIAQVRTWPLVWPLSLRSLSSHRERRMFCLQKTQFTSNREKHHIINQPRSLLSDWNVQHVHINARDTLQL